VKRQRDGCAFEIISHRAWTLSVCCQAVATGSFVALLLSSTPNSGRTPPGVGAGGNKLSVVFAILICGGPCCTRSSGWQQWVGGARSWVVGAVILALKIKPWTPFLNRLIVVCYSGLWRHRLRPGGWNWENPPRRQSWRKTKPQTDKRPIAQPGFSERLGFRSQSVRSPPGILADNFRRPRYEHHEYLGTGGLQRKPASHTFDNLMLLRTLVHVGYNPTPLG